MKNKKILSVGLFIALIAIFAIVFYNFREKPVEGSKSITIEVVNKAGESTMYSLKTDAKYLEGAMNEAKLQGLSFEGTKTEYGLTINTVNGETADISSGNTYWGFFVNDGYCNYGVSEQPVEDGDAFRIVYTVYTPE